MRNETQNLAINVVAQFTAGSSSLRQTNGQRRRPNDAQRAHITRLIRNSSLTRDETALQTRFRRPTIDRRSASPAIQDKARHEWGGTSEATPARG